MAMIRMMDMTHHAFHRHCFTGSVEELRQWEMELPAVKFGVTMRSAQDPNLVARIPVERLLLETDAPYLLPAPGCKMNHPWNLASLAAQVASIRNTPVSFILETCNNNARQFYRL
ncbi:3'-5' ssDNA/RNA exonuclease TatD-like [Saccostrea cucullata]|uniref:3'-5' ssDNA/RNA exonuclease TatD-like n=1 Tax=Saccostrea cuccullata TaxID=36930 RepID=UPI002ED36DD2